MRFFLPSSLCPSDRGKKNTWSETLEEIPFHFLNLLPAAAWVRQKFHTAWSAASHYTAQFNWLCSSPVVIIQGEESAERISCSFAIKSHRDSIICVFGQIMATPVGREWERPEDISQLAGSKVLLKGLVKHDGMRCILRAWLTTDTENCFRSASGQFCLKSLATYLP